ncbi:ArsR/SmtB family transcription factor [Leifsonia sp. McL0607]|uniref:ArsR/SmtB family transcription factor n=1 Tax=Leifsonia sp. McL0607 TaxID=3415672 RepID=UPI003CEA3002
MSFTSGGRPEDRRTVTDPRALRALAHPLRLALLDHLMSFGARTASECADAVGSTPSNCSYHLRALARFGLVERVEAEDGRERPWQSTATGLQLGRGDDPGAVELRGNAERCRDPSAEGACDRGSRLGVDAVERFFADHQIDEEAARLHRAIALRDSVPPVWRESSILSGYALRISPGELRELGERLDALIRPYIALTRTAAPGDSAVVALNLNAFLHPDAELPNTSDEDAPDTDTPDAEAPSDAEVEEP